MVNPVGNMKCFHPQTFNDNIVSCGRCPACKQNRINGWVCRLERHSRHCSNAHFVTLTYADKQATKTPNGLLTLDYSHVQHFFKTLNNIQNADYRKKLKQWETRTKNGQRSASDVEPAKPKKFSYYVAGEYGSKTKRPHYHIILFNASLKHIHRAWAVGNQYRRISRGNVHTGSITGGSIRYTLKYINKPSRLPLFQGDDRAKEFSYMSKGIGKNYINQKIIAWHRADIFNRYYVPNAGGVQTTMPRYYAQRIYTDVERILIGEHLEKIQSENFYKEWLRNDNAAHDLLESRKYIERKAFTTKNQSNL